MNAWGERPLLELARSLCTKLQQERDGEAAARAWYARQDERIWELEQELEALRGRQLSDAKRRLAGLRRARTLGPAGLKAAAIKAAAERQGLTESWERD